MVREVGGMGRMFIDVWMRWEWDGLGRSWFGIGRLYGN
jgi:hypothetical protein